MDDAIEPVELAAGELLLRPFQSGDADAVFAACQDPEIQRWTTVPVPYTRADAEEFVAGCRERWASGMPSFAVVEAVTRTLLGSIGVVEFTEDGDAEIGYWVTPDARGGGVATRATQAVSAWVLRDIGMARLTWHAQVGNVASRRVAESAGFVVEGTARRGMVHRGERVDAWVAAMLESDLERAGRADASPSRVPDWPYRPVELRTERLLLRAFRDEDAPSLLAYARDPMVVAWDQEHTPDLEAAVTRARNRVDWSSGELAAWAITDLEDREVLGGIVLSDVDAVALSAEVGYGLMPESRGHGYTAEALRRVTEWAFTETGLSRIELRHAVGNAASCAVARAAGYAIEGTMRQSYRFGDGLLHDEHLHARLRTDPPLSPSR